MENFHELEKLPNIGACLAQLLVKTGINTPDDLYETGSIQAFIRIKAIEPDACFSKLCALEGAVEGIRWHYLSREKKLELKQFFYLIDKTAQVPEL
jgi:DNA transformation protein and related proteins